MLDRVVHTDVRCSGLNDLRSWEADQPHARGPSADEQSAELRIAELRAAHPAAPLLTFSHFLPCFHVHRVCDNLHERRTRTRGRWGHRVTAAFAAWRLQPWQSRDWHFSPHGDSNPGGTQATGGAVSREALPLLANPLQGSWLAASHGACAAAGAGGILKVAQRQTVPGSSECARRAALGETRCSDMWHGIWYIVLLTRPARYFRRTPQPIIITRPPFG